jgi:hypothetical protein
MTTGQSPLEHELEMFRTEEEAAQQYFFGYLSLQLVPGKNPDVLAKMNETSTFWVRALAGHPVTQTNASLIEQGLDRLRDGERPPIDVAFATELLRLLQRALAAYELSQKAQTRPRKS